MHILVKKEYEIRTLSLNSIDQTFSNWLAMTDSVS